MTAADAREAAAARGLVADDGGHSGGSEEDALLAAERPLDDADDATMRCGGVDTFVADSLPRTWCRFIYVNTAPT